MFCYISHYCTYIQKPHTYAHIKTPYVYIARVVHYVRFMDITAIVSRHPNKDIVDVMIPLLLAEESSRTESKEISSTSWAVTFATLHSPTFVLHKPPYVRGWLQTCVSIRFLTPQAITSILKETALLNKVACDRHFLFGTVLKFVSLR